MCLLEQFYVKPMDLQVLLTQFSCITIMNNNWTCTKWIFCQESDLKWEKNRNTINYNRTQYNGCVLLFIPLSLSLPLSKYLSQRLAFRGASFNVNYSNLRNQHTTEHWTLNTWENTIDEKPQFILFTFFAIIIYYLLLAKQPLKFFKSKKEFENPKWSTRSMTFISLHKWQKKGKTEQIVVAAVEVNAE